jgi:DNA-binding GntR family transcriptional regulator
MTLDLQAAESGESAAATIEKDLRRAIIELELLPGTRLSEQEIANRLGVSRQPVREALIRLANSRLIEIRPHRGTVVARISAREMTEALFVRQAVEIAVVAKAASRLILGSGSALPICCSSRRKLPPARSRSFSGA